LRCWENDDVERKGGYCEDDLLWGSAELFSSFFALQLLFDFLHIFKFVAFFQTSRLLSDSPDFSTSF
jgi:hypothetical protein